jgi:esterase
MRLRMSLLVAVVAALVSWAPYLRAQTAQPVDRYATVNGLRLHYLDWGGTGRPLVLVHGLDRHAHTFDHLAPHFTSRFRVIAVDMRGHGESAWDAEARYAVEDYVRDMEGLVDQLQLRDIVIWGRSMPGCTRNGSRT